MMQRMYRTLAGHTNHRWAFPLFLVAVFVEAVIFVPAGTLLTIFCLEQPKKSIHYALGATIASVLGGILAYWLGSLLLCYIGTSFISHLSPHGTLSRLMCLYQEHGGCAIFIASLTPFPYKLLTLSAGFCHIAFLPFVLSAIMGRSIRFFGIALFANRFGPQVQQLLRSYFNYIAAALTALFIASCYILH